MSVKDPTKAHVFMFCLQDRTSSSLINFRSFKTGTTFDGLRTQAADTEGLLSVRGQAPKTKQSQSQYHIKCDLPGLTSACATYTLKGLNDTKTLWSNAIADAPIVAHKVGFGAA